MEPRTPPVRFADGSDSIVEGLAVPFGGPFPGERDAYRTRFDRANLHLDWFDRRPILYDHGQNGGPQLSVVGTVRTADITDFDDGTVMGKWVRGELDKSNEYHAAVASLVKAGALGWSHGTLSYLMDADPPGRDGVRNIREWPLIEFSLTPREASPFYAQASLRGVDEAVLRILGVTEDAIAVRGWLPEGTSEGDLDDGDFAWIATDSKLPDSQRRKLPYKVHGKVNEAGWKAAWSRAHQSGTDFSGGPNQAAVIKKLLADAPPGVDTKYDDGSTPLPGGRSFRASSAAADAQSGAYALASILSLMGDEAGEAEQLAMLQSSADALKSWIDAEQAEIGTPDDDDTESYWMSANRAGARNSAADQAHLDAAHQALATAHGHLMAIGAHGHTADEGAEPPDDEGGGSDDDTTDGTGPLDDGRSADLLPRGVLRVLSDAEATERQTWLDAARAVGREHAATLRRT